jgi:hypothetical protein
VVGLLYLNSFGQAKLIVQFASKPDTVKSGQSASKKVYSISQAIIVPSQKKDQKYRIVVKPDYDRSSIADSNILMGKSEFQISQDSAKVDTFNANVVIKRDSIHERSLYLKLAIYDSAGNKTALCDSCNEKLIYIEKYEPYDSANINHEFWLFIGTNLDLVDGIQAQDLYFRADYLFKIKKKQWFFVSLGKNRYFDYTDSVFGAPFGSVTYPAVNDSLKYTSGHFNGVYVSKTENLFFNLKHLFQLSHDNNTSNFFLESGVDLQYLTTTRYWKGVTITDSSFKNVPAPPPSMPSYFPFIVTNFNSTVQKSWNYNFSTGIMHIFNQHDLNIKTQLMLGLNYTQYPKSPSFASYNHEVDQYSHNMAFFTRFRMDATVLSPGVSFGFEVYTIVQRSTDFLVTYIEGDNKIARPLFNISLTKVLDIKHIKSLLSGVTPLTN